MRYGRKYDRNNAIIEWGSKKQNNDNEKTKSKNKNKDINSYHVDSAKISKLNETIQSHVESY